MKESKAEIQKKTAYLIRLLEVDSSESRKTIAALRTSKASFTEAPEVWGFFYRDTDNEENSTLDDRGYEAVYGALKLYALHRRKNNRPHAYRDSGGVGIGEFLGNFKNTKSGANIDAKMTAVFVSMDYERILRLITPIFRRAANESAQKIDYAGLASDLYFLQTTATRKVISSWAKTYYLKSSTKPTKEKESK